MKILVTWPKLRQRNEIWWKYSWVKNAYYIHPLVCSSSRLVLHLCCSDKQSLKYIVLFWFRNRSLVFWNIDGSGHWYNLCLKFANVNTKLLWWNTLRYWNRSEGLRGCSCLKQDNIQIASASTPGVWCSKLSQNKKQETKGSRFDLNTT